MKTYKLLLFFFLSITFVTISYNFVQANTLNEPIITLNNESNIVLEIGVDYVEYGAVASDKEDGELTSQIIITDNVDTSKAGTYEVIYSVTDSEGYSVSIIRNVFVIDYISWELNENMVINDLIRLENGDFIGVGDGIIRFNSNGETIWTYTPSAQDFESLYLVKEVSTNHFIAFSNKHKVIFDKDKEFVDIEELNIELEDLTYLSNQYFIIVKDLQFKITNVVFGQEDEYTVAGYVEGNVETRERNKNDIINEDTYLRSEDVWNGHYNVILHYNQDGLVWKKYVNYARNSKIIINKNGIFLLLNRYSTENDLIHLSYDGEVLWHKKISDKYGHVSNIYNTTNNDLIIETSLNNHFFKYVDRTVYAKLDYEGNDLSYISFDNKFSKNKYQDYFNKIIPLDQGDYALFISGNEPNQSTIYMMNQDGEIIREQVYPNYIFNSVIKLDDGFFISADINGSTKSFKMNDYLELNEIKIKTYDKEITINEELNLNELVFISDYNVENKSHSGEVLNEVGYYNLINQHVLTYNQKRYLVRTKSKITVHPLVTGVSEDIYYESITPNIKGGVTTFFPNDYENFTSGTTINTPGYFKILISGNNDYQKHISFTIFPTIRGIKPNVLNKEIDTHTYFFNTRVYRHAVTPDISLGYLTLNGIPYTNKTTITDNGTYSLRVEGAGYNEYIDFIIDKPNKTSFYINLGILIATGYLLVPIYSVLRKNNII